jgi:cytosine/adenosine deaminase-related metal-dependent hydrolase
LPVFILESSHTSVAGEAKSRFEHDDLMERGRALIEESLNFGVTHMRAFVEVDQAVGMKCLVAGLALKEEFHARCYIQICAFAQDPIFSYEDGGEAMRSLLETALNTPGVEGK